MFEKILLACSFSFFLLPDLQGQNLVFNPSFELCEKCPEKLGNLSEDVQYWSTPTAGSTDYFNACSVEMGTPKNFNGAQTADFGDGYAGLYYYAPDDYREYLQVELRHTLKKGEKYQLSFYVSLAERSDFAIKEFGVLFAKDAIQMKTSKNLSKNKLYQQKDNQYHSMEVGYSTFYSDTDDWILVHTEFEAKGFERFILLGNFKNNRRTRLVKMKKQAKQGAYYYLDMIALSAKETISNADVTVTELSSKHDSAYQVGELQAFENVLFVTNEFKLSKEATTELDDLFAYLLKAPHLSVTIIGHTDIIGSSNYNRNLSAKRARSVAQYLMELGLPEEQISWQGAGASRPIAANNTEVGRKQNRRVEFLIKTAESQ